MTRGCVCEPIAIAICLEVGLCIEFCVCQYSRGGTVGGGKTDLIECSCTYVCPDRFCVRSLSMFGPQCHHGILLPMVRGCLQTSSAMSRYVTLQPDYNVQSVFSHRYLCDHYTSLLTFPNLYIFFLSPFLNFWSFWFPGQRHGISCSVVSYLNSLKNLNSAWSSGFLLFCPSSSSFLFHVALS